MHREGFATLPKPFISFDHLLLEYCFRFIIQTIVSRSFFFFSFFFWVLFNKLNRKLNFVEQYSDCVVYSRTLNSLKLFGLRAYFVLLEYVWNPQSWTGVCVCRKLIRCIIANFFFICENIGMTRYITCFFYHRGRENVMTYFGCEIRYERSFLYFQLKCEDL